MPLTAPVELYSEGGAHVWGGWSIIPLPPAPVWIKAAIFTYLTKCAIWFKLTLGATDIFESIQFQGYENQTISISLPVPIMVEAAALKARIASMEGAKVLLELEYEVKEEEKVDPKEVEKQVNEFLAQVNQAAQELAGKSGEVDAALQKLDKVLKKAEEKAEEHVLCGICHKPLTDEDNFEGVIHLSCKQIQDLENLQAELIAKEAKSKAAFDGAEIYTKPLSPAEIKEMYAKSKAQADEAALNEAVGEGEEWLEEEKSLQHFFKQLTEMVGLLEETQDGPVPHKIILDKNSSTGLWVADILKPTDEPKPESVVKIGLDAGFQVIAEKLLHLLTQAGKSIPPPPPPKTLAESIIEASLQEAPKVKVQPVFAPSLTAPEWLKEHVKYYTIEGVAYYYHFAKGILMHFHESWKGDPEAKLVEFAKKHPDEAATVTMHLKTGDEFPLKYMVVPK